MKKLKRIPTVIVSELLLIREKCSDSLQLSSFDVVCEGTKLQDILGNKYAQNPEVLILHTSIVDRQCLDLIKTVIDVMPMAVVIFTSDERLELIEAAIDAGVSSYIINGFHPDRLKTVVYTAIARFQHQKSLHREVMSLKNSLNDRKIIERAKGLLMSQRQCSEQEAFHWLRSTAMNENRRIAELAENVITTQGDRLR